MAYRLIPACAGNTDAEAAACVALVVNPRMRGEHIRRRSPNRGLETVNPRMRGEHSMIEALRALGPRLIPACAGNT